MLSPHLVAASAKRAASIHTGIMLLEQMLQVRNESIF